MRLCFVALCVTIFQPLSEAAELEPHESEPYRIVVDLRFSDDPIFTDLLRRTVAREVRDLLANYFGELGEIEVDPKHALWDELDGMALGDLTGLPAAVDRGKPRDKAFLVDIDCENGVYQIQGRQLNLEVGRIGDLFSRTTADRHCLAKAVCLAIKEDFSPVGVVLPGNGNQVSLQFRGGKLRTAEGKLRLALWLDRRTALEPLWVIRNRDGGLTRAPIPLTAITIEDEAAATRGQLVSPWADPLKKTARVVGVQAVKFRTQTGNLSVRVVGSESGDPVAACAVYANGVRFSAEGSDALRRSAEGWFDSHAPFDGLAYVTIKQGETLSLRFLQPITRDRCAIECKVRVDELTGRKSDLRRRLRYLIQDVQVLHGAIDEAIRAVNAAHKEKRYEEALKQVRSVGAAMKPQVEAARSTLGELSSEAEKLKIEPSSMLGWAEGQIKDLQQRRDALDSRAQELEQLIASNDIKSRVNVLLGLAGQAESAGQIDDALEKYRVALQEYDTLPEQYKTESQRISQHRKHYEELAETWKSKGAEHDQARKFVTETLSKAAAQGIKNALPRAREAFDTLRRFDDFIVAKMMIKALDDTLREIADLLERLEGRGGEEDRKEADQYQKLSEEIIKFRSEIRDWLQGRLAGAPPSAALAPPAKAEPGNPPSAKPASVPGPGKKPPEVEEGEKKGS